MRGLRPGLQILDRHPLAPLRDCLRVDPQLTAQRRERSLRSLYCCSDGVRGRGAPVTNLSNMASFHSNERIAPSNRGIKHQRLSASREEGYPGKRNQDSDPDRIFPQSHALTFDELAIGIGIDLPFRRKLGFALLAHFVSPAVQGAALPCRSFPIRRMHKLRQLPQYLFTSAVAVFNRDFSRLRSRIRLEPGRPSRLLCGQLSLGSGRLFLRGGNRQALAWSLFRRRQIFRSFPRAVSSHWRHLGGSSVFHIRWVYSLSNRRNCFCRRRSGLGGFPSLRSAGL